MLKIWYYEILKFLNLLPKAMILESYANLIWPQIRDVNIS